MWPSPYVSGYISSEGEFFEVPEGKDSRYSWHEEWCLEKFGVKNQPDGWIRQGVCPLTKRLILDLPKDITIGQWETLTSIVLAATGLQGILINMCGKIKEFHSRDFHLSGCTLSDFLGVNLS